MKVDFFFVPIPSLETKRIIYDHTVWLRRSPCRIETEVRTNLGVGGERSDVKRWVIYQLGAPGNAVFHFKNRRLAAALPLFVNLLLSYLNLSLPSVCYNYTVGSEYEIVYLKYQFLTANRRICHTPTLPKQRQRMNVFIHTIIW